MTAERSLLALYWLTGSGHDSFLANTSGIPTCAESVQFNYNYVAKM